MTMPRLTEFGKKLSRDDQRQALALADVAGQLRKAGEELYPDVPWSKWTPAQWEEIYARADEMWAEERG